MQDPRTQPCLCTNGQQTRRMTQGLLVNTACAAWLVSPVWQPARQKVLGWQFSLDFSTPYF